MKDKAIYIRISANELETIRQKAHNAKMNLSQYITNAALGKSIVIVEGLKDYRSELRKIGNNLNQIATLCNMGKIKCVELDAVQKALTENWRSIRLLQKGLREDDMNSGSD